MRFYLVSYLLECIALALVFKLWLDNLKLKDTDRLTYTVHMICYNIYDTLSFYIIILGFRNIIVSNMSGCDAPEDEGSVGVPGPVLGAVEHPAGGDGVGARLGVVSVVDVARGVAAVVTN